MPDLAYVNGHITALEDAVVSVNDRGFTFADSIYDYLRTCNRKPFLLDLHIERITEACSKLHIPASKQIHSLPEIISSLIEQSAYAECALYIQISRGAHPRDIIFPEQLTPTLVVTAREFTDKVSQLRSSGVKAILHPDLRWQLSAIKTSNLLGSVIAKNKAASLGAKEAILFNNDNVITEACSSSVFIVKNKTIITSPLTDKVVASVTRDHVINRIAALNEVEILEREYRTDELLAADEVFITATSLPILPIVEVDANRIADGKPGSITKSLIKTFLDQMEQY